MPRSKSILLSLVLLAISPITSQAAETASPPASQLVSRYCVDCHGPDSQEGGLRLDTLSADLTSPATFARWVNVHDRIAAGEMPPAGEQRPTDGERDSLLADLQSRLRAAESDRRSRDGRVVLRRLTRFEYEQTLRDLLALPNLEVSRMLPDDSRSRGFDNVAETLDISSVQMARYLDAADAALDAAMALAPQPVTATRHDTLAEANNHFKTRANERREAVEIGAAIGFLRQGNTAQTPWTWNRFQPPDEGAYRIRVKSFGFLWDKGEVKPADRPHIVCLYAKQGHERRRLAAFDVAESANEAATEEFVVWLRPGEVVELLLATLDDRNLPKGVELENWTTPGIAFEWLEVEGPLVDAWPPESHRRLFGDLPVVDWTPDSGLVQPPAPVRVVGSDGRARRVADLKSPRRMVAPRDAAADSSRLLREFATRAFRRPVSTEEIEPYLALVRARLDQKACFQDALRVGYKAILCSPELLYFREEPGILDDFALATRLSYFLWSSLPDEELLPLARARELSSPQVLRAQVERMLGDPKADRFIENLTGQWLDLRKITLTEPDERLYPEFNQLLLDSMTAETRQFVAEMLKNDLDASHLVDSDFLMINGPLAKLYGIEGCEGVDIRKVSVPEGCIRGGLLTQASMLKITSNGTTTSPVSRGAWILDRLLGEPVPPPPPNTPAIEPDLRGATTIGDLLKKHRSVASCASCHTRMDPPGFALESFDVIGGWRERYRTLGEGEADGREFRGKPVVYKLGQAVDHGDLPLDESNVVPIEQLRQTLLSDKDKLARNLAERLIVYATGAEVTFSDRPVVDDILSRTRTSGHGLRSLVHEVVQSSVFRSK